MENFYLILVIILFALAISDLIVGVSNDAVNFLNSAVGAKAAPLKIILLVAGLGILAGATFSGGMMEVARKGIFHPDQFMFHDVILIFLAVMISDIILLDVFNTFGLPTSTTVSIVFDLLGAAVGIATINVLHAGQSLSEVSKYINSEKALAIISGILLSVVVAFVVGAVIMYFTRMLFTFNFNKTLKRFGALYGGLSIAIITYFILIKGAKGTSFMTEENVAFIHENTLMILGISFIGWTIIFQLLRWIFNFDILKAIVLVGTFALAMAFAGNDLVNFIGVPLAGFESFRIWIKQDVDAKMFLMSALTGKIHTPTYFLLISGAIMFGTLYFSKKARTVIKTSVDLSRQGEGHERFGSSFLARSIVRTSRNVGNTIGIIVPKPIKTGIQKRFDQTALTQNKIYNADAPAFDMLRASVNLVVASILIAFATSLKLPLSTTYVTFMVAMGTSLSDKAWGRESAVYRITGVFSVVGGWFLTALSAFTVAFLVAIFIHWAGIVGISIMIIITIFLAIRTHRIHTVATEEKAKEQVIEEQYNSLYEMCSDQIMKMLEKYNKYYANNIEGLIEEKRNKLNKTYKNVKSLDKKIKGLKDNVNQTIARVQEEDLDKVSYYVQVLDYMREMSHSLRYMTEPVFKHVDNNHTGMNEDQTAELQQIKDQFNELLHFSIFMIKNNKFDNMDEMLNKQQDLIAFIGSCRKNQVKRIKKNITGTKNSMLYLEILSESKSMVLYLTNLLKSQRDFLSAN